MVRFLILLIAQCFLLLTYLQLQGFQFALAFQYLIVQCAAVAFRGTGVVVARQLECFLQHFGLVAQVIERCVLLLVQIE